MNSKYTSTEFFCQGCGISLGTGYRAQRRTYCTNQCQKLFESKKAQEEWLATGRIPNWSGGKSGQSPGSYVRRFILEAQNHQCAICEIYDEWYDKPLTFILDHVNGDSTDNRRENLRLICPNCDSQTSTFKARNKGNGRRSKGFSANKGL